MNAENIDQPATDPTIPIILGVTGHRDLQPDDIPLLKQKIRSIFDELHRTYPDTPLLLLSPLAEGADRLAAQVALEAGGDGNPRARLVAPLPLPRAEYEKDFETPESKKEFNDLIDQSAAWFELPLARGNTETNIKEYGVHRNQQYALAGSFIVFHSQILIALWDGADSGLEGGTGQIVKFKLEGIPAPYAGSRNPLDVIDTGPVYHVLTPRKKNPNPRGKHYARRQLFPDVQNPGEPVEQPSENQLEANPKPSDPSQAERAKRSYEQILRRMNDFNRDAKRLVPKLGEQIKENKDYVIPEEKTALLPEMAYLILGHYAVADTLSLHFQSTSRRALIAIFLLALLAVISFEVYAHLLTEASVLALYPIALGGALLVYLFVTRHNYQSKYLDYRALAEGLRVQLFWRLAGLEDEVVDHYLRKQRTELDWIRNAIRARNVPVTQVAARDYTSGSAHCEPDCLQAIKELVRDHWLNDQRNFFTRNTGRDARKLKRHELTVKWLFRFGLALSIGVVFLHIWFHETEGYSRWHHWLIVTMGTAPAIAAAIGGYAEKMAFSVQAKRYQWMSALYTRASKKLDALLEANQLSEAQELIRQLGKEALEENGDWVSMRRERSIEVPLG